MTVSQLADSFSGPIKPVRSTIFYQMSTVVVAILMICLPLIYIAITAGAAYGVFWHAVNSTDVLEAGSGKGRAMAVLIGYLGPLVIGGVLVVFMVKPLFAPRGKHPESVSISERDDPELHQFIGALCDSVGAPKPKRIDVVCDVNASASFRRGWASMLGNDLVLTIGLPLVSCMDVRQLTGVLAHEFGHFAQGIGMRASYVIGSVNHWFARVVYQRDAFDEKLDAMARGSGEIHWAIAIVLYQAKFCVWLTRRILWLLMLVGHLFSSILSRQMEFDADKHAYRAVGSDSFSSALKNLPVIVAAEQRAYQDLGQAYREERLVDNLPALIQANAQQIPGEYKQRIIDEGMTHNTGMYDSHPCTTDRIKIAENGDGVFLGSGSAEMLFADYEGLCQKATLNYYRDMVGLNMRGLQLIPTSSVVAHVEEQTRGAESFQRYFLGCFAYRPIFRVQSLNAKGEVTIAALSKHLQASHQKILDNNEQIQKDIKQFYELDDQRNSENVGRIPRDASKNPVAQLDEQGSPWQQAYDKLVKHGKLFNQRLNIAVMMAELDETLVEAKRLREVKDAMKVITRLSDLEDKYFVLRAYLVRVEVVIQKIQEDQENRAHYKSLENCGEGLVGTLREIKDGLHGIPYPFDHRQENIDLASYIVNGPIRKSDPQAIFELSQQCLENVFSLTNRIMITFAIFGEKIDESFDLPILPKIDIEEVLS